MDEYPIRIIPDTPHWSENFAFAGFDPAADIELFCHIGRWRRDPGLWREIVTIALPDGTVALHRGIGNALATLHGPGGGNFQVEIIDPQRAAIRLRFHGAARAVTEAALGEHVLHESGTHLLSFDLLYEGVAPVWDISKAGTKSEFMGAGHIEQFGRLHGTITFGGAHYAYDSVINRDHSRGVRVVDSNIRHSWLQGYLEDGLMFQLYEAEIPAASGPGYSEASVVRHGIAYPARAEILDKLPFTDNRHLIRAPVTIRITYDDTTFSVTATEFVKTISLQSTGPNDLYIGRRTAEPGYSGVIEQAVRYRTDDGRSGYGHMERLVPGKLFDERP